jgi:helicase conserved domain protein
MPYNKKAVLAANTQAIRIILRLEKEQRLATEEERIILGAYQGFGGLKCVLNRTEQPEDIRYWAKSEARALQAYLRLEAAHLPRSSRCSDRQTILGEYQG